MAEATTHNFVDSVKELLLSLKRLLCQLHILSWCQKKQLAKALSELRMWNLIQHTRSVCFL